MAYATISQNDDLPLADSPSPRLPEFQHTSLSLAFDDFSSDYFPDGRENENELTSKVGGIVESLTASSKHSYELVEEDDYETLDRTVTVDNPTSSVMQGDMSPPVTEDVPVRTASVSKQTPLNHPTPDLQSAQGAYLKHVERLEDSAERLSMASSLEQELGKMKEDIRRSESLRRTASKTSSRRLSATSMSNSIVGVNATARAGGYSPAAFVASPVGSVNSTHRRQSKRDSRMSKTSRLSNSLPEPEQEGAPLDSPMAQSPPVDDVDVAANRSLAGSASAPSEGDRPGTAASNDTFEHAQELFDDFDGTHFSPVRHSGSSKRKSMRSPPFGRASGSFEEAMRGEGMVYYPAPVPVMLNLPTRLSRGDWTARDRKRLQALKTIEDEEKRKSAAWVADADSEPERQRPQSQLPPQLRASAFFDKPGTQQELQLKDGSAVATLDSILDAAAFAPVSAFTDHPIAGHLGDEVYGPAVRKAKHNSGEKKAKRRNSFGNLLKRRSTEALSQRQSQDLDGEAALDGDDPEHLAEKSIAPDEDELGDDNKDEDDDSSDDGKPHQLGFRGAPTTLLAELQMRKEQQRQRNRTAADAFPGGMHSTLLELDAVTQLQQKSRKMKHVTLAWEDREAADKENFDDDDVPLGVLFPEKERASAVNYNRPLGLMEKRELEDNEPLSSRRARLLGVSHPTSQVSQYTPSPGVEERAPILDVPVVQAEEQLEEAEEETLAQRAYRMRLKKENRASFADEVTSTLGWNTAEGPASQPPDHEETLGERRRRLREEAARNGVVNATSNPGLKSRVSLADLLHANPAGRNLDMRPNFNESKMSLPANDNTLMGRLRKEQSMMSLSRAGMQGPLLGTEYQDGPAPYIMNGPAMNRFSSFANGMQGGNIVGAANMGGIPMPNPFLGNMPVGAMNTGGMNMGNPNMGGINMGMGMSPYGIQMANPATVGPTLDPQQRAKIDAWRQGVV